MFKQQKARFVALAGMSGKCLELMAQIKYMEKNVTGLGHKENVNLYCDGCAVLCAVCIIIFHSSI